MPYAIIGGLIAGLTIGSKLSDFIGTLYPVYNITKYKAECHLYLHLIIFVLSILTGGAIGTYIKYNTT